MLKKILIGIAVVLVALVVLVAVQPSHFSYTRSRTMSAPQPAVFAQVNDFHKWNDWSPWAKLDLHCKNTFSGADAGKGAVFAWAGNSEVGEGKMTITESRPHDLIRIDLEFIQPMEGKSLTEFTFKPEGEGKTVVTWTMSGENNFVGKAMSLVMDCEKLIGGQFEKGLESMEKSAKEKR